MTKVIYYFIVLHRYVASIAIARDSYYFFFIFFKLVKEMFFW